MKSEQITAQKRELQDIKGWAKKQGKKILRTIELGNNGIRVIIQDE